MDNFKNNRNLTILGFAALFTFAAYLWVIRQDFFHGFVDWSQQNFALYFIVLILIKIVGIVWPPLPGGVFTLGSTPVIGWFNAYLADVIGGAVGASIAYFLGKKYGHAIIKKLFDESIIKRINNVKIAKNREIEAIFVIRLFTGSISEAVSYGSGLLRIRYRNFLIATLAASLFLIPIFYIAEDLLSGKRILINIAAVLTFGFVFYKLRGRYFE